MLKKLERRGVHLVKADSSERSFSSVYHVGERIPASGIYRAIHGDHRLAHEVTLLTGDRFPRCKKCGDLLVFELVAAAPEGLRDQNFRIRIYEIPHPDAIGKPSQIA